MPIKIDLDGLGQFVERVFGAAGHQSKVWIGFWSATILGVTTLIACFRAPAVAYGVPVVVVLLIVFAGNRSGRP